ncbi:MAG: NDP-sugar synthase [Chlorobiaceae bacterium]
MKAFVLAAGFGTRLKPLTDYIPKPLIPVLNIPSIFYTFFQLKKAGIREIICNTHHHANTIRCVIESSNLPELDITFSEEPVILGTGGGLKNCEKLIGDNEFLLVNSDIITDIDLAVLIQHHRKSQRPGTLTLFATPEAPEIGYIGIENGLIKDFRNLRHTNLVSSCIYTGIAVLTPEIFRYLKSDFSGIVDTGFTGLIENGGMNYFLHEGMWMDIGIMQNYWKANLDRDSIITGMTEPMNRAIGMKPHPISNETDISPDARISNSVIGCRCRIGANSTITDSVLLPGVYIKPGSRITKMIIHPFNAIVM